MKRLLLVLLLLSIGLNIGLVVRLADDGEDRPWSRDMRPGPGPMGDGPRGEVRDGRRFEGLDLSEDQHDRLAALRGERRLDMEERRQEMRILFADMRELLQAEELDHQAVAQARRRLGAVRAEVDSLVSEQLLVELEILTPEQRGAYLDRMHWERFRPGPRGRGKH